MNETWRDVPGYEGRYSVSDHGRVMSFQRGNGKTSGEVMRQRIDKNGRPIVGLWKNRKRRIVRVSTLVASAFIGPCPDGLEVCHNDGDEGNNAVGNLRYDTHKNNCLDRIQHGTQFRPARKLSPNAIRAIRVLVERGARQRDVCKAFGVSQATVSRNLSRG